MNTPNNPKIDKYVGKLSKILRHLSTADREDIVKEIKCHIQERWETDSNGSYDGESLKGVLGKFGSPEVIAAQYCEERGWAVPPKGHAVRNTIIIVVALIAITVLGSVYFGAKYIVNPVLNIFSGEGELVKINDEGIEVLGGSISINDDGIKIGGTISISGGDEADGDSLSIKMHGKEYMKEEKNIEIPAEGISKINIENTNGQTELTGADVDKVSIKYIIYAKGNSKDDEESAMAGMKLAHEVMGEELKINANFPQNILDRLKSHVVDVSILVPKKASVTIQSTNGKIEVAHLEGGLKAGTTNGKISIQDIGGNVTLSSRNGKITAEDVGGDAIITNENGKLDIENIKGFLKASAKNGSIDSSKVGGDIEATTKNGSIDIELAKDYGFKMTAGTRMGSVKCNFPTHRAGNDTVASVGDGLHAVNLTTKLGSIKVNIDE